MMSSGSLEVSKFVRLSVHPFVKWLNTGKDGGSRVYKGEDAYMVCHTSLLYCSFKFCGIHFFEEGGRQAARNLDSKEKRCVRRKAERKEEEDECKKNRKAGRKKAGRNKKNRQKSRP